MKTKFFLIISIAVLYVGCNSDKVQNIVIKTTAGEIYAEIYTTKAPITASNFLTLIDNGVFNTGAACFYRVVRLDNQPNNQVKIEVIQGGLNDREQTPPIIHETTDETKILHTDGVLSMARNKPGSASSEFFICIGDQPELDFGGKRNPDGQGFASFGKVTKGMEVVKKIQQAKDENQYLIDPIKILSIKKLK